MHPSDYGGPDFKYIVRYKVKGSGDFWTELEVGADRGSVEVTGVNTDFQEYDIQVISQNALGRSATKPVTVIGVSEESGMFIIFVFSKYLRVRGSLVLRLLSIQHVHLSRFSYIAGIAQINR